MGSTIDSQQTSASLRYQPVEGWGSLPEHVNFGGDAASVAVDSRDYVYVFNRGTDPLVVFDSNGSYQRSLLARDEFVRPHGITIDSSDALYLVDEGGHFVEKRTKDGELILRLGTHSSSAVWQSGDYFNRPTDVAVHESSGDIFVADGYGNSRIHRFSADGTHLLSWGTPGSGPREFSLPHGLCLMGPDRVAVCDRENFRLQIFTLDGMFVEQWHAHHPSAIAPVAGDGGLLFVGEMGPAPVQIGVPNLGHSVSVVDYQGHCVTRLGGELPGTAPWQFIAPHGIAVDSSGDVYVAEVSASWSSSWWGGSQGSPANKLLPSLRKWRQYR